MSERVCITCATVLTGQQTKYCSTACGNEVYKKQLTERYRTDPSYKHRQLVKARSLKRLPRNLVKPPCQLCGETMKPRERHHDDYSREDDVIWVCRSCHKKLHAAERRSA